MRKSYIGLVVLWLYVVEALGTQQSIRKSFGLPFKVGI
jgi:hypothetical protein